VFTEYAIFSKKRQKKRARPVSKTEEINGQTIKADLHQRTMGKFVKPFLKPFVLPQQFDFLFVTFVKKSDSGSYTAKTILRMFI